MSRILCSDGEVFCSGPSPPSRYTLTVGLHQVISVAVLTALLAIPISGPVCAVLCATTDQETSHHDATAQCEESQSVLSTAQATVQMRGITEHGCPMHDGVQAVMPSTGAERAAATPALIHVAPPAASVAIHPVRASLAANVTAAPGAAPPRSIPLVLRV